jgi:endo-1,4-beta-xylanase
MSLDRRNLLKWGIASLAGFTGTVALSESRYLDKQIQAFDAQRRDFSVEDERSLKERAAEKGLLYGAACRYTDLTGDAQYAASVVRECALLVPEWEFQWSAGDARLRPAIDRFDFSKSDWMEKFAKAGGMKFRGVPLVWHLGLPSWFEGGINRQNAEATTIEHIKTVVGRYRGKMYAWDVVNEAVNPFGGRSDLLQPSPWLEFIGADYVDLAFRVAAETDPDALLVYNDYGMEYDTDRHEKKRVAVLKFLEKLKAKGTPVQALGIQAHLWADETRFSSEKIRRFLAQVASLGLKIFITELDVTDKKLPQDIEKRDRLVASAYEDYLSAVLDEPAVTTIITWGFSDRYTWISEFHPRPDGAPVRPLPIDANLKPKLAWRAMARAIENAPNRTNTKLS